jgi:hypothetical protein
MPLFYKPEKVKPISLNLPESLVNFLYKDTKERGHTTFNAGVIEILMDYKRGKNGR